MTPLRGQANRPVDDKLALEQDASLSIFVGKFREPERVPQPADEFNYAQRQLEHIMTCTKVGCTRCAA